MPKYKITRKMRGGSKFTQNIRKWLGRALNVIKRSGVTSAIARDLAGSNRYGKIGADVVKQLGYGKRRVYVRRRQIGSSLRPVGGSLMPTGGGMASSRMKFGRR